MSDSPTNQSILSNVSDIYKKMTHKEHVLKKPDTYIGSVESELTEQYIYTENDGEVKLEKQQFSFCPGFYKCFDELIVNAFDHSKRQASKYEKGNTEINKVTSIKVEIDKNEGFISVYNDGDGIDIDIIPEHNIYPPELIFGTLLTSTNYDDNEKREWGGRNGYGAKLANIFSTKMIVDTVDVHRSKKYIQVFENNMSDIGKPKITKFTGKPYTKITWYPDFDKFNLTGLDDTHIKLFKKRVYDISACSDKIVSVHLDKIKITEKTFDKYVNLYLDKDQERVHQEEDGWTVVASYNNNEIFEQVSFVNGINTVNGGKHVDYVVDQIKEKLAEMIKKKKKLTVKPIYVKNQLSIFINATIVNPVFDGQTKETLKTNKNKFEHYINITDKFITKLYNSKITELIIEHNNFKENKGLEKTDGKKKTTIRIPKLCDANLAGTVKHSKECTLILTEGDSAKTMAISGLSVIGRDLFGVFPLKGKVLNVRNCGINDIQKNTEIANIKKIIGLQSNKDYSKIDNEWPLRYGKIMLMTDQDLDGSHIKGLIINLFDCLWPSLLDNGFVCSMITPIIKAIHKSNVKSFYTIQDFENWQKSTSNSHIYSFKYYKGLGTSTTSEAKEYFKELKIIDYERPQDEVQQDQNVITIDVNVNEESGDTSEDSHNEEMETELTLKPIEPKLLECKNKIVLAFDKNLADNRKEWLYKYNRNNIPDFTKPKMDFNEFIDTELIHYSNYDNDRSIPNLLDGFKPSIRKTMFGCFKKNLTKEIKVAQLAGYISEHSGYHHGEKSLEGTIVGLAQNFVGSNNLNLLEPIGQFGTRLLGGKDSAQSRYIFTQLTKLSRVIFNKKDDVLYKYLVDDGTQIEPEWYCGIIPMVLVNGTEGIGTGFSTSIPSFNPMDLIRCIKSKLTNQDTNIDLIPWYRGFTGTISKTDNTSFITKGKYRKIKNHEYEITELPVGSWTEKYIEYLDKVSVDKGNSHKEQFIKSYKDNSSESTVQITVKFEKQFIEKIESKVNQHELIEKYLKLTSKLNTGNMWLFNNENKLKYYKTVEEIFNEWFGVRFKLYEVRKQYLLNILQKELKIILFKVKFILEIINDTIDIRNKSKKIIYELLESKEYPKISSNSNSDENYDYLLKMDLFKLSKDEIDELTKIQNIKQTEVEVLTNKSAKDIWIEELDEIISNYNEIITDGVNKKNKTKILKKK